MKKIFYLIIAFGMTLNLNAYTLFESFDTDETCSSPPEIIIPGVSTNYVIRVDHSLSTNAAPNEQLFLQQFTKSWVWEIEDENGNLVKTVDITNGFTNAGASFNFMLSYPSISDLGPGDYNIYLKVHYKDTPTSYGAGKNVQVNFNGAEIASQDLEVDDLIERMLIDCIRIQECSDIDITITKKLNRVCLQVTGDCEDYSVILPGGVTPIQVNTNPRSFCVNLECGLRTYTFRVIDCNGCVHTKSIRAYKPCDEIPGGLAAISLTSRSSQSDSENISLSIFPNPACDMLNFNWEKQIDRIDLQVFDVNGKLITVQNVSAVNTYRLDVSDLDEGYYFVKCVYGNGFFETKRFAVVR